MDKLFLDANILFTATYSSSGASRVIFELAERKKVVIFSSKYAIKEAQVNILNKIGENHFPLFYKLISILHGVDKKVPLESEMEKYKTIIVKKDIPILLSALELKVDYLITLDKRDFKNDKIKSANFPFAILQPGEYLKNLLK